MVDLSSSDAPLEVRLRLSAHQLALVRPGIARIVTAYNIHRMGKSVPSSYRLRNIRQPTQKRLGQFDEFMMRQVLSLWPSIRARSRSGLRLRLNTFQIRACILGLRIQHEANRDEERRRRTKLNNKPRTEKLAEFKKRRAASAKHQQLGADSRRVIAALERHMKVANRQLTAEIGREDSELLVATWNAHLRWMRCHLVYYQPRPSIGGRRLHRMMIDRLVTLAVQGLRTQGYDIPEGQRLRILVRRAFRYHRERRVGHILMMNSDYALKGQLSYFIQSQEDSRRGRGTDQE